MDVPYLSYVVKFVCKESINLYLFCMQINWLFFYFNQSDVSSDDSWYIKDRGRRKRYEASIHRRINTEYCILQNP